MTQDLWKVISSFLYSLLQVTYVVFKKHILQVSFIVSSSTENAQNSEGLDTTVFKGPNPFSDLVLRPDRSLRKSSRADQLNHIKTGFIDPLNLFPAATDRITRLSQKVDGSFNGSRQRCPLWVRLLQNLTSRSSWSAFDTLSTILTVWTTWKTIAQSLALPSMDQAVPSVWYVLST